MKCRFEIVGLSGIDGIPNPLKVNGKQKYRRLLIKKVNEEDIKEPKDVALLMQYNKKFLIIGNGNAVTYKELFPLIKENKLWLGVTMYGCQQSVFIVNTDHQDTNVKERWCDGKMQYSTIVNTASWFTNLDHNKRHEEIDLYKKYNAEEFPKYDNYDAINVNKVCDIPLDYDGIMGVPISFLGKYCPTQFEIIWTTDRGGDGMLETLKNHSFDKSWDSAWVNGEKVYKRIFIKKLA